MGKVQDEISEIMKNLNNSITQSRGERGEFVPFLSVSAHLRDNNWVLMKSLMIDNHK